MSNLEKYHIHVATDNRLSVVWAENPFEALFACKLFDECSLVDTNRSLNKFVFSCTMAEPHAVSPCDVRRVTVYEVG